MEKVIVAGPPHLNAQGQESLDEDSCLHGHLPAVGKPDALAWLRGGGHLPQVHQAWRLILHEVWNLASPDGPVNGSNFVRTLVQLAGGVSSE